MDSMDIKGIAWVGNIYQKFEAMCLEVEEAMCQETAKYVENQVQTVGASMKRFCSDVMQDLVPPSSKELSRVASADLILNPYLEFGIHKKSISSIKEDDIDPVCIKGISEDKSNFNNDAWEDWSAASINWEISDKGETNCDRIASNETIKGESRVGQEGKLCNMIVETKSNAKVGKRSRRISSSKIIRSECTDASQSRGLVSQMGTQATSNTSSCQSIDADVSGIDPCENSKPVSLSQSGLDVSANTQCDQSVGDEVLRSHTGSSADCDRDFEEENDTSVQMMGPIEHNSDSGFEETCVLVDRNDYRPENHEEEKRRSYKKKIQNAFSLKKKSTRTQEYKQLAGQYGYINGKPMTEGEQEAIIPLSKNTKSKELATANDSLDSEWELL